jgi:hypothetical protein
MCHRKEITATGKREIQDNQRGFDDFKSAIRD